MATTTENNPPRPLSTDCARHPSLARERTNRSLQIPVIGCPQVKGKGDRFEMIPDSLSRKNLREQLRECGVWGSTFKSAAKFCGWATVLLVGTYAAYKLWEARAKRHAYSQRSVWGLGRGRGWDAVDQVSDLPDRCTAVLQAKAYHLLRDGVE